MGAERGAVENMVSSFWSGKRIFITGHTGFKGAWLSLWLQTLGAAIRGFAQLPPTNPNLFEAAKVGSAMESTIGDVRSLDQVNTAMQAFQPEIVFHLAAQSLVRASYLSPSDTFATNVLGTAHVLDAARSCPSVKSVVIATSDKCYENKDWPWPYRETDSLGGHDPYSASKACAELVVSSFRAAFFDQDSGTAIATVRAGNVVGGGDWAPDRLIPDLVRSFTHGISARIRNPAAVRPWQHVLEPLRGYLMLAEKLYHQGRDFAGAWNFGPDPASMKPVSWLVQSFAAHWTDDASWHLDQTAGPHEARTLSLDSSKASALVGWRPALTLPEAVTLTADWYLNHAAKRDMRLATIDQINSYTNKLNLI